MTHVSMTQGTAKVIVGVDTHADTHVAAALDSLGRVVGRLEIPTTPHGYGRLLSWSRDFDTDVAFGIEGAGAYGAGLARFLSAAGCHVAEINRPDRRGRRSHGKSDPLDAEAAARSVLAGAVAGVAKADHDRVGMIRTLRVARRSALKMRTQAINQMKALVITAPDELRSRLRQLTNPDLVTVSAAARPGLIVTPIAAAKLALRSLAIRYQGLTAELETLDVELCRLTAEVAPVLIRLKGVGPDVAGALLVAAGDNPERLRSDAAFASLCGVSPVPASSGKTNRYRLNRGGDRIANNALWRIVMVRLTCDERTQTYVARRTAQGMAKRDIIRCLKRYVAREVFHALLDQSAPLSGLAKA
jgi:transposase